jgi:hypothetical protein
MLPFILGRSRFAARADLGVLGDETSKHGGSAAVRSTDEDEPT